MKVYSIDFQKSLVLVEVKGHSMSSCENVMSRIPQEEYHEQIQYGVCSFALQSKSSLLLSAKANSYVGSLGVNL